MKAVIAIDSFKGSLSTFASGEAVARAIHRVYPDAVTVLSPLADGGEGTVEAITYATGGEMRTLTVHDPLSRPVTASYGIIPNTHTAVLEMASAAGITLLAESERNPLYTTTYGVGEMIADAIARGCRHFIVGIGGSATNDGGVGMLQALGFDFLDASGAPIPRGALGLQSLCRIGTENVLPALRDCSFCVACDVTNPLCGERGCSAVFGPQKGATPPMIRDMDTWLSAYAALTQQAHPQADPNTPGSGAAGGMGFAFLSYLGAELRSGIDIVMEATGLETHIRDADVVITGEGRLDGQSAMGKAPIGVARLAKRYGKTVLAFAGCVSEDAVLCNQHGIDAFFPILQAPCSLSDAMDTDNAYQNLLNTATQVFLLWRTRDNT